MWHWTVTFSLDFQGQILKYMCIHISGRGELIDMEQKGCDSIGCWTHDVTLTVMVKIWIVMSQMGGPIDMEQMGCESILACWTHNITLTLDFQGQSFK